MRDLIRIVEGHGDVDLEHFIDLCPEAAAEHGVELEMRAQSGKVVIDHIGSTIRGAGLASATLKSVTELADQYGVVLTGCVHLEDEDDGGGLDQVALFAWCQRNGVVRIGDGTEIMRQPVVRK